MSRPLAALVLAGFLAGPGLRAHCFVSCADTNAPVTATNCHEDPASGPALAAAHACARAAPAVGPSAKRAGLESPGMTLGPGPLDDALPFARPSAPGLHGAIAAASPPVKLFLTPLRI